MTINIAAFTEEPIRSELITAEKIWSEVLNRCYSIPGYKELPLTEKNRIYDRMIAEYVGELDEIGTEEATETANKLSGLDWWER